MIRLSRQQSRVAFHCSDYANTGLLIMYKYLQLHLSRQKKRRCWSQSKCVYRVFFWLTLALGVNTPNALDTIDLIATGRRQTSLFMSERRGRPDQLRWGLEEQSISGPPCWSEVKYQLYRDHLTSSIDHVQKRTV